MKRGWLITVFIVIGMLLLIECEGTEEEETINGRADDDFHPDDDDTIDDDISDDDVDDDAIDDDTTDDDSDDDVDDDIDDDTDDDTDDDIDDDCDDQYEPNDTNPGYNLGNLDQSQVELYALIGSPYDIDKFYFYVSDPWYISFSIEAWLDGIPPTCNYNLFLYKCGNSTCQSRELKDSSTNPAGEPEYVYCGGVPFQDDGGFYQVEVTSEQGYNCSLYYHLRIEGNQKKEEGSYIGY